MNGSQWINQSESASFSRDIVVSSRILLAEGILLRSNGIEPSSVSKGAPRISIYLFLRGVEDTPSPFFFDVLPRVALEFKGKFLFRSPTLFSSHIPFSSFLFERLHRSRSISAAFPVPFYCITASLAIIDIRGKQL